VRDGGGIKPDIEVLPDSMPNIAYYLQFADTTDLLLNYEIEYMAKHRTVAEPSEFEFSDKDYDEFCAYVIKSGFEYDQVSEKYLKDLEKLARFEGYYEDAKPEFEALKAKLKHDLKKDLAYPYNKEQLKQIIANDIMSAYYFDRGALQNSLRYDKQFATAAELLKNPEEYRKTLAPIKK